jgi:hypothetical protein
MRVAEPQHVAFYELLRTSLAVVWPGLGEV